MVLGGMGAVVDDRLGIVRRVVVRVVLVLWRVLIVLRVMLRLVMLRVVMLRLVVLLRRILELRWATAAENRLLLTPCAAVKNGLLLNVLPCAPCCLYSRQPDPAPVPVLVPFPFLHLFRF
jgi:hypothetical protein